VDESSARKPKSLLLVPASLSHEETLVAPLSMQLRRSEDRKPLKSDSFNQANLNASAIEAGATALLASVVGG